MKAIAPNAMADGGFKPRRSDEQLKTCLVLGSFAGCRLQLALSATTPLGGVTVNNDSTSYQSETELTRSKLVWRELESSFPSWFLSKFPLFLFCFRLLARRWGFRIPLITVCAVLVRCKRLILSRQMFLTELK